MLLSTKFEMFQQNLNRNMKETLVDKTKQYNKLKNQNLRIIVKSASNAMYHFGKQLFELLCTRNMPTYYATKRRLFATKFKMME